jgi:hypothetical protein
MKEGTLTICLPTLCYVSRTHPHDHYRRIPDVALADEDTGMVDRLGETELVDAGLETALQEVLDLQGQDVIEPHATLVEHTNADETADQGVSLEETLGVLLLERQERTVAVSDRVPCWAECQRQQLGVRTGQHDGSWKGSTARARPRACCGDHTRRRA